MIVITVKSFGIFQEYFPDKLILHVSENITILLLREKLFDEIKDVNFKQILIKSVFSDGNKILNDTDILLNNAVIYLLPPFSGG